MAAYLTATDAQARLAQSFGIDATLYEADVEIASDIVDGMRPFIGERYADDQERAFPRTATLPGDTEGVVPERVLDAVCLIAYADSQDSVVAVKSESVLDQSVTYDVALAPKEIRRAMLLIAPYQRRKAAA